MEAGGSCDKSEGRSRAGDARRTLLMRMACLLLHTGSVYRLRPHCQRTLSQTLGALCIQFTTTNDAPIEMILHECIRVTKSPHIFPAAETTNILNSIQNNVRVHL
eukprot:COSAG02_NODE_753_length_17610_cov_23.119753_10_plen_105_part_00